jgi:hypothetical protein
LSVERLQLGDGDDPAIDQVAEHTPRADGRQLRRIADDDQVGLVLEGREQRGGQLDIEHRRLVDDDELGLDRIAFVVVETR